MNDLPVVSNPFYSFEFPTKHRFPMQKFRYLLENLQSQGIITSTNLFRPGKARRDLLELAHCSDYVDRFISGELNA